jgi:hypothetical protein
LHTPLIVPINAIRCSWSSSRETCVNRYVPRELVVPYDAECGVHFSIQMHTHISSFLLNAFIGHDASLNRWFGGQSTSETLQSEHELSQNAVRMFSLSDVV